MEIKDENAKSHDNYRNCDASNPVIMFTDGNLTFEFDQVGHCPTGQRMIVRVMAWTEDMSPSQLLLLDLSRARRVDVHHSSAAFRYKVGYGAFVGLPVIMVVIFA
ncbi:hypothetical protein FCM35_KLT19245 [Carex littledalei]|uniref:Phytocyanin domain-containing protein n=1 Tax=Carex littledalei TaxID=544730 RepID=A0A833VXJ0_9POAL|nr:hypothetical protein FCM35_KLT19245 [Carex littledalei]